MRALLYVIALIVCSVPACWSKVIELTDIEVEYAGFFRDTILNKHYHNNKGYVCIKSDFLSRCNVNISILGCLRIL